LSAIWVLHWSDKHYLGHMIERGTGGRDALLAAILGGHVEGSIDGVDMYDTDEHVADDVSEDIALELARRVVAIGDPPTGQVRDFIEEQCGIGTAIPAQA
jgi:hypothetical protein